MRNGTDEYLDDIGDDEFLAHAAAAEKGIWDRNNRKLTEFVAREGFGVRLLKDDQWRAVDGLVFQKRDTILKAKTGFGKSLIFQLAPLLYRPPLQAGIALILMPLKLLEYNQSAGTHSKFGASCCVADGDTVCSGR